MKSFTYTIKNKYGIHIRPAGELAREAKRFHGGTSLTMTKGDKSTDLTRHVGIMGLDVKCGDTIVITAEGEEEEEAASAMEAFLMENL